MVHAVPSKGNVEWDVVPAGGHHANATVDFGEVLALEICLGGIRDVLESNVETLGEVERIVRADFKAYGFDLSEASSCTN